MPRLLTPKQKQHRVKVCEDLHRQARDDPTFMSRIITSDEKLGLRLPPTDQTAVFAVVFGRNRSLQDRKAPQVRNTTKSVLVVFSVVHHELIPQHQTVNTEFYCDVLKHLRRPELWGDGNWVLQHSTCPSQHPAHHPCSPPRRIWLPAISSVPQNEVQAEGSPFRHCGDPVRITDGVWSGVLLHK